MEVRQEDIDAFIAWLKTKGFDAIAKSSVELSPMSLQAFKDARPLQRPDMESLGGVPSAYAWGDLYVRDFKDYRLYYSLRAGIRRRLDGRQRRRFRSPSSLVP
jgi:hypothetical protein